MVVSFFRSVTVASGLVFLTWPACAEPTPNFSTIGVGDKHVCVLEVSTGKVGCFGDNSFGQLGNGTTEAGWDDLVTALLPEPAVSIATGLVHNCASLQSGKIACWGNNEAGQLGNGGDEPFSSTPVFVSGIESAVSVSTSWVHTCAVLSAGTVYCWGPQESGILGNGEATDKIVRSPVQVKKIRKAVSVATGTAQSYAILSDGTVMRWGSYGYGWATQEKMAVTPAPVAGLEDVTQVAAGRNHACALTSSGNVFCWGSNTYGQLGQRSTNGRPSDAPVQAEGLGDVKSIVAGVFHACALKHDGNVFCWGRMSESHSTAIPVRVSGMDGIAVIASGSQGILGLTTDGQMKRCGVVPTP